MESPPNASEILSSFWGLQVYERGVQCFIFILFIYLFDLFREGCPSTEVVFQGTLQKKHKEIVNPVLIF